MNVKLIASALLTSIIAMSGCDYNPEIITKTNDITRNITTITDKNNSSKIIFSITDGKVTCKLKNCILNPFNSTLYNKIFSNSKNGPAGVMAGTYYNIENSYGLDIYAAGYTEEGEVDFYYIIVSNGDNTKYIELPMNSNYSITNNLVINGYSSTVSNFSYKIDFKGNITNLTS